MAAELGGPPGQSVWIKWLTPARVWKFLTNLARLERTVEELKSDNQSLREKFEKVELRVAENDAQLRLLTGFVRDSLNNRLEARIDKLAAEFLANKNNKNPS